MSQAVTTLATLLNRMDRWSTVAQVEEQYKVRDLDDALRTLKRSYDMPFYQKKTSLKVFSGVYQYPVAADHDYLIYIDRTQIDVPYAAKFRARYTSMKQFFENPDYRNQVAEVWEGNTLTLGVWDKNGTLNNMAYQTLDTCSATTGYTISGDASNVRLDNVNFIVGESSIAFTVTSSAGSATIEKTLDDTFTDANYLRNWHFRWVYLGGATAPTSITLRFGVDSSNYLYKAVTAQFAGQAFNVNQWNLVAFDLNAATTVGTIDTSSVFGYDAVILTGAPTGTYNIDTAYLRAWELADYWYYSRYAVQTADATQADQEYFYSDADTYSTDSELVGDHEWADVVMYDALISSLTDKENFKVLEQIKEKRAVAWKALETKWPDLKPQMTTTSYRFGTDYSSPSGPGLYFSQ